MGFGLVTIGGAEVEGERQVKKAGGLCTQRSKQSPFLHTAHYHPGTQNTCKAQKHPKMWPAALQQQ